MIWKIAKKEFLLNLMTFKFTIGMIVCVVLMAVFMPVLVGDYQQRLKDYNENVVVNEAELRKAKVYKNLTPTVYRPPNILSVFSKGIDDYLDNSEKIDMDQVPEIGTTISETNTFLSVFPALDVTLIFKIVVSILAFLIAYDVISGEKEQGTLKLMLSGATARHRVLLGKLVAGLMTLLVPVTASFIVGLLVLLPSRMVSLTWAQWFSIVLMYLASSIFTATIFNLGLCLSCLSKSSATSLIFGLFLWLFLAALLPNSSVYIASQFGSIDSPDELSGKLKMVTDARKSEIDESAKDIKKDSSETVISALGAFGHSYSALCNKSEMDYLRKLYPITEPIQIKYANKLLSVKEKYMNNLIRQKQFAETIAAVSPFVLYENVMSTLAGTNSEAFQRFRSNIKDCRNKVADYIRSETENFTSTSYFTPSKEGDYDRIFEVYYKPFLEAKDKEKKAELYKTSVAQYQQMIKDTPPLNLQDFPKFTFRPQSITDTLRQAIPKLGWLVVAGIMFFLLSYVAFLRYDVR
jgi:ABC-type transport system involved in multi-copper enzyme maturation permease subunit